MFSTFQKSTTLTKVAIVAKLKSRIRKMYTQYVSGYFLKLLGFKLAFITVAIDKYNFTTKKSTSGSAH